MDKIINQVRDIGTLRGKLLVFGGVYSNLQALEAMKQIADAAGILPENILCTGDVVAYCAQPEESVQRIKNWGIHVIAGNVEIQLRSGEEDCGCNFGDGSRCDLFSRQWYPYAQSQLSEDAIAWMHTLPDHLCFTYADRRVYMLHGSFFDTSEFVFKSTPWSVKAANFEATQADIILSGHCGLPFQDVQDGKYWLNAGVIGMPANDGTTRVWYMILEATADGFTAQHHSFSYDNVSAAALMAQNGLPKAYSGTLLSGIWDNCDILPEEETAMQGIALG